MELEKEPLVTLEEEHDKGDVVGCQTIKYKSTKRDQVQQEWYVHIDNDHQPVKFRISSLPVIFEGACVTYDLKGRKK